MRIEKDNKYGYRSWTAEDVKKYAGFLAIPVIVVALIVVILVMDKNNGAGTDPKETVATEAQSNEPEAPAGESSAEGESEAALESSTEETTEAEVERDFAVNGVPEMQELMNTYFTAKQNADADTICKMFGWTDEATIEAVKRGLQYDARYTEGYRNITCYTKAGADPESYLVFVSYDLKFKSSLTLAPGLMWTYAKKDVEGNYVLSADENSLNDIEKAEVQEANQNDEIVLLKTQVYAKLRQALESDSSLAEGYGILEKRGDGTGQSEAEVKLDAAAGETAAGAAAADEQTAGDAAAGETTAVDDMAATGQPESGSAEPTEAAADATQSVQLDVETTAPATSAETAAQ